MLSLTRATERIVARLPRGERGASLVEYALLVALIAVVCIVAVMFFGDSVSQSFDSSGRSLHASP